METLSLIVIFMLIGAAIWLVLLPLWQRSQNRPVTRQGDSPGQSLEEYQSRYLAKLAAIKDLNFDHEMGKVSTEDYEALLAKTKLEAAQIRQQLDALSSETVAEQDASLEAEIEAEVAELRRTPAADPTLLQEVEAEIQQLKTLKAELDALTCPACDKTVGIDDQFCSECGQSLTGFEDDPGLSIETTCPQCGYSYEPGDAFCARCGEVLNASALTQKYEDAKI